MHIIMRNYPDEFKASVIARLLPPNNASVVELSLHTGIPKDTLYTWRLKYRRRNEQAKAGRAGNGKRNSVQKV